MALVVNRWYTAAAIQERPDAFYRLADSAGSSIAADQTFNGYTGTVVGTITFGQSGWSGDGDTAALFGGGGYIDAGNVSALAYANRVTIAASFKSTSSARLTIVSKAFTDQNDAGWQLCLSGGKLRFIAASTSATVFDIGASSSNSSYNDGVFHQAIATYDAATQKVAQLFVDGVKIASVSASSTIPSSSARVCVGAIDQASSSATNLFNGTLDEVALYPYHMLSS